MKYGKLHIKNVPLESNRNRWGSVMYSKLGLFLLVCHWVQKDTCTAISCQMVLGGKHVILSNFVCRLNSGTAVPGPLYLTQIQTVPSFGPLFERESLHCHLLPLHFRCETYNADHLSLQPQSRNSCPWPCVAGQNLDCSFLQAIVWKKHPALPQPTTWFYVENMALQPPSLADST